MINLAEARGRLAKIHRLVRTGRIHEARAEQTVLHSKALKANRLQAPDHHMIAMVALKTIEIEGL